MLEYIANIYNYLVGATNNHNVFVFDIDCTITNKHTGGSYSTHVDNYQDYINYNMRHSLIKLFSYIKDNGDKIYINSRGRLVSVYDLCRDIGINIYIDGYYCARDDRSSDHIIGYTCDKYNVDNSWGKIKTRYLEMICKKENINKTSIYFFDDAFENIYGARNKGFTNSFIVNSRKYPNITDEYNLVTVLKKCIMNIYDDML